jgi:2-phospho-L-lactate guanylyltransferase
MPDVATDADRWSVVVPVKRLVLAKSRLAVRPDQRVDLAIAMAADTVRAALDAVTVAEVVVVTDDTRAARALAELGARVVGDEPDDGLNPALRHGAAAARGTAVAALSSDLPSLRAAALDIVLRAAVAHRRAVVADAGGAGTTLLAVRDGDLEPAFGAGSFAAHLAGGAVDLTPIADLAVRHDVDTVTGLGAAVALGVGPATTTVLAAHPGLLQ